VRVLKAWTTNTIGVYQTKEDVDLGGAFGQFIKELSANEQVYSATD